MRVRWAGAGGVAGNGPPVVLLHGFTGSAAAWGEAIPGGLARPVLLVDLPGHGPGARPDHLAGLGFLAALDLLLESVAPHLDGGPADWVGYSMGGRIALALALRHPGRVRRLVLESASPGLATARERAARKRRDEALARRIESGGLAAFVDEWMAQPLFRSQAALPAEVRDEARRIRLGHDPEALAEALRVLGTGVQPSFWDELGRLAVPTLLLTGSGDPKFRALARQMHEALPRAEHEEVAGAGHAVHLEAPGAWLRVVRSFLAPV